MRAFRCTVICMRHVFFNCNACSLAGEVLVRAVEKARLLPIVALFGPSPMSKLRVRNAQQSGPR